MRRKISKYRILSFLFLASFILVFSGTVWAYTTLYGSSQPLILHFSEYSGITRVGSAGNLLGFGIFGMLIIGANFFIALNLEEKSSVLGKLMAGATVFGALLIFITLSAIISVN